MQKLAKMLECGLLVRGEVVVWAIELNYSTSKLSAKNK